MITRKVWVQSSNPYTIRLTLKQLQTILNDDSPLDLECFNMVVRKFMFGDIQTAKKKKGIDIKPLFIHAILGMFTIFVCI